MIGSSFAVSWIMATAAFAAPATEQQMAPFMKAVDTYREFVTVRCAPEMVKAYTGYSRGRDVAFIRSLEGTPLRARYFEAVRAKEKRDVRTIFHCDGPPPPPPANAAMTRPDPRTLAIQRAQERLQSQARDLPSYFDGADAAFMQMQAARDAVLAGAK